MCFLIHAVAERQLETEGGGAPWPPVSLSATQLGANRKLAHKEKYEKAKRNL